MARIMAKRLHIFAIVACAILLKKENRDPIGSRSGRTAPRWEFFFILAPDVGVAAPVRSRLLAVVVGPLVAAPARRILRNPAGLATRAALCISAAVVFCAGTTDLIACLFQTLQYVPVLFFNPVGDRLTAFVVAHFHSSE